jgi:hypothetical protein
MKSGSSKFEIVRCASAQVTSGSEDVTLSEAKSNFYEDCFGQRIAPRVASTFRNCLIVMAGDEVCSMA